jgi:hypothetical protein
VAFRNATLPPSSKGKGKGNSVAFYFLQKNEDEVFTKKRQNLITGKVLVSPRKWLVDICAYQTIEN